MHFTTSYEHEHDQDIVVDLYENQLVFKCKHIYDDSDAGKGFFLYALNKLDEMATGGKKKYFYSYNDFPMDEANSPNSEDSGDVFRLYGDLVNSDKLVVEAETNGEAVILDKIAEAIINGDYCLFICYIAGIVEDLFEDNLDHESELKCYKGLGAINKHDFMKEYFHISYEDLFNNMLKSSMFECEDVRATQMVYDKPHCKPKYVVNRERLRNAVENLGLDTSLEKKCFGEFFAFN